VRRRPPTALFTVLATGLVVAAAACDTGDGKTLRPPTEEQRAALTTTTSTTTSSLPRVPDVIDLTSTTVGADATIVGPPFTLSVPWGDGGVIDAALTCDGEDRSPSLAWTAPPVGTVELALLVTDDDADGFVHWAVAGIAPAAGELAEGTPFPGAIEGTNGFGAVGWGGPCPPTGAPHTYRFTLYALNQQLELPEGFSGEELLATAEPAALDATEAIGTYQRAAG
jgi:Raf kinase inhibitor-like YbhB/YbcL family protein